MLKYYGSLHIVDYKVLISYFFRGKYFIFWEQYIVLRGKSSFKKSLFSLFSGDYFIFFLNNYMNILARKNIYLENFNLFMGNYSRLFGYPRFVHFDFMIFYCDLFGFTRRDLKNLKIFVTSLVLKLTILTENYRLIIAFILIGIALFESFTGRF